MQYKNITLALVLLAFSAIVSASTGPAGPATDSIETKIFAKIDGEKKLTAEALADFALKPHQVKALVGIEFENAAAVKAALDKAVAPQLEEQIFDKVDGEKKLTAEALADFSLKPHQVKALVGIEFENAAAVKAALDKAVAPQLDEQIFEKVVEKKINAAALEGFNLEKHQIDALVASTDLVDAAAVKAALDAAVKPKLEEQIFEKVVEKKITAAALEGFNLEKHQIDALVASTELVDAAAVKAILDKTPESQSSETSNPTEKLPATVDNILKCVLENGKLKNVEELKNIDLTENQIKALSAADLVINKDFVEKLLTPSKPSDPITAEEMKAKVDSLFALVDEGKMKPLSTEQINNLKLNEKQVKALQTAEDLSADSIKQILENNADVASSNNSSSSSAVNSEEKWYTKTWFLVLSGAVVLSALGGGVYMMTNKSDETDL